MWTSPFPHFLEPSICAQFTYPYSIHIIFLIILKYSWFTVLIFSVQWYSQVTQFIYIYTHIHTHIYMYISFSCSFPLWFITGYWIQFPVLRSKTLLFISPKFTSFHLLIPSSNPSFPHLTSPLATRSLLSMSLRLFLQHIPLNQIFTLILLKWLEY